MPRTREPVRRCLGCRESFPQRELMRLVRSPQGEVLPDAAHKMPGRGAYLCYRRACIRAAVNTRQFARSFRQPVAELQAEPLQTMMLAQLEAQLLNLLSLLRKAGQLQVGGNLLDGTLKPGGFAFLLMAADIAPARAARLEEKARDCGLVYGYLATKEELGRRVGKGETSALGISTGGLAERFKKTFERYCQLSGEL